jgi:hypothetical protein
MPLVQLPHSRRHAEDTQRARAAYAEHHLLPDASRFVTAVEAMSDVAMRSSVFRTVGIQQVDRNASDLRLPQSLDHIPAGTPHGDLNPLSVGFASGAQQASREHRVR